MREDGGPTVHDLANAPLLTVSEERSLLRLAKGGDGGARHRLILANIRLILKIARPYVGRIFPLEDAVGEGVIGLDRAIEGFDLSTPYRFSTYAYWWIRQAIQKAALVTARGLKTPSGVIADLQKLTISYGSLWIEQGREPSIEELSHRSNLPEARVVALLDICLEPVSLDTPCHEGGDTLGEMQVAPQAAHVGHSAAMREFVDSMLVTLPESQQRVLEMRYGLDGCGRRSYREVAEETGWSRETIKRNERKAIRSLQSAFSLHQIERELDEERE